MTVLSRRAVGACLVAGPALWLSTSVFDRVGTGAGTRVAFFSSWPELAGLTVLVLLTALLLQALAEHLLLLRGIESNLPAWCWTPLVGLAVLAIPFLPWIADRLRVLDALAGPGRWWVWAVAGGQVLWLIGTTVRDMAPPWLEPGRRRFTQQALVFGVSVAIFVAAAWRLSPGPLYPGGDEPHYLVVTQSLLTDHDLAIANNHARGDYLAYYQAPLKPDYRATGRNGVIYSIHPVGISALIAPAFALWGYRGASLFLALLAAAAVTLTWRVVERETASASAATVAWLAVATSAPFLLHSFAIYPECAAALAVMIAIGRQVRGVSRTDALVRGVALAALPWLGTKYAPMSAVSIALLLWRLPSRDRVAVAAPYVASLALWFGFFWWLYGTPSPSAPYGSSHQMSLATLAAGLPGLFLDQEYGAVATAPALGLAIVGLWRLWRRDADGRWMAMTTAAALGALAVTTGSFALWWGGSAPPGRELVAALPLVAVPLGWLWHDCARRPVQRAGIEWLVLVGIATTVTLVVVHNGLLIANGRDGASQLLGYLEPARHLVRDAPSFVGFQDHVSVPWIASAIWIAIAAIAWRVSGGLDAANPGRAALAASGVGLCALVAAAIVVPAAVGRDLPPVAPVEARSLASALDDYDARARPLAIEYAPFRLTSPAESIVDLRFVATPGMRRAPQPARVVMNARFALAAGTYRVALTPRAGASLSGEWGVQVGRLGGPMVTWPVSATPGAEWSTTFTLDLDAGFVGFRASPDLEVMLDRIEVQPLKVVDAGERPANGAVLAAARYGDVPVYFHDDRAYLEAGGFWTRGVSRVTLSAALPETAASALPLRLRSAGGPLPVRVETPAWSTRIVVGSDAATTVSVPARTGERVVSLAITAEAAFVPAEHGGPPGDRRALGCWVEVGH